MRDKAKENDNFDELISLRDSIVWVRDLARKNRSPALAQLASHMEAATHSSGDVFGKITGLIRDMISKLEEEALRVRTTCTSRVHVASLWATRCPSATCKIALVLGNKLDGVDSAANPNVPH